MGTGDVPLDGEGAETACVESTARQFTKIRLGRAPVRVQVDEWTFGSPGCDPV